MLVIAVQNAHLVHMVINLILFETMITVSNHLVEVTVLFVYLILSAPNANNIILKIPRTR